MIFFKVLFWSSLFLVFYTYIGYGILVFILVKIRNLFSDRPKAADSIQPHIALIISAYNEEDFIEQKIKNTLELDYPKDKLDIIFITDGSNDRTPDIVRAYPAITLLHQPQRQGKAAAMNRAIQTVTAPYVIFCDANTLLNRECISQIARHYADPKVGGVAGEKVIMQSGDQKVSAAGEGLYWKYESFLKKQDSQLYSVVGAAGELFSVRTALYESISEGTIIEDFVLSLRICMKGYVIRYEPGAYAMEAGSATMKEEQKRKIRISAGAFQAMGMLKELFNVYKFPLLSFQYISHRVLRWTLCPVSLITLFVSNVFLVANSAGFFYQIFFLGQLVFYLLAVTGWLFANRDMKVKAVYVPYYFLFMNFSVFLGFYRYLNKKQTVLWEKAARKHASLN
jgi:cellulose synthase/poly-beta-1,6-N-acetylglucosamine synthase-like glycosyltransferase